ncbi:hypothetical protein ALTER154_10244 [Alteromonas sp. 154]|nr:hypothetical protein ALTER154_10244 [Alteromonas sp. 154]
MEIDCTGISLNSVSALVTVVPTPNHAKEDGALSGLHRKQGRKPSLMALAAWL